MATYTIAPCTVADSAAITRNNMTSHWMNPHRRLTWPHRTLEYHISQISKRMPRTLLVDRETSRHQKAVDTATGCLQGYARWHIPRSHATNQDGSPAWPETIMPAVGPEEEAEIERVAQSVQWDPNPNGRRLGEKADRFKQNILARKPYMRLDYLAVHPDNQNQGIGSALSQCGMRQAEMLGLDIFVYSTKAAVGVYRRLGFRMEEEIIQDDSMYEGGTGEHYIALMIYEQNPESNVE